MSKVHRQIVVNLLVVLSILTLGALISSASRVMLVGLCVFWALGILIGMLIWNSKNKGRPPAGWICVALAAGWLAQAAGMHMFTVGLLFLLVTVVTFSAFMMPVVAEAFKPTFQVIGQDVAIGSEWTTLTFEPKVVVRLNACYLFICLPVGATVVGVKDAESVEDDSTEFKLIFESHGPAVKVEVQFLDVRGAMLELSTHLRSESQTELAFTSSGLVRGGTFVAARVRSNHAFNSPRVEWKDYLRLAQKGR